MPHRILRAQLHRALRDAAAAARSWREVGGLLVDTGYFLRLVPVRTTSRREWSFALHRGQWLRVERGAKAIGALVVGTYHSHVAGEARLGDRDIRGAYSGDLKLIFDTVGKRARLWRIRGGRAYAVKFELI